MLNTIRTTTLFAVALIAAACSPLALINGSVDGGETRIHEDIAYGDHPRQSLNVYVPGDGAANARKVVVFFYGGRWQSGSKTDYLFVGDALTDAGLVAVIPDHRLYPEVRFPAFVDDAADAVRWVRANIADYGGDPDAIYLAGHSSGAHLATLIGLDESRLDPTGIRGVIGISGPYDFLPFYNEELADTFAGADNELDTQPIHYVDGDEPPLLLITGEDDHTVDPGNTRRLAARIRERGGDVSTRFYPDTGHYMIIAAIARPLHAFAPTLDDLLEFVAPAAP